MKIVSCSLKPYSILFTNGLKRKGAILHLKNQEGKKAKGEIAPYPGRSKETLEDVFLEFQNVQANITHINWSQDLEQLEKLNLSPSFEFGLESALFNLFQTKEILPPLVSGLFMGSFEQILLQAESQKKQGITSAKLKVGHLSMKEARDLMIYLQKDFTLRIDVNCSWKTEEALAFFSEFPFNAFEYVEEPFQNPKDLHLFSHPLAIDESYPTHLSLSEIDRLPNLKALIYKPSIQGGARRSLPLHQFAKERKISLILSSSFESPVGTQAIVSLAHRLKIQEPLGIGTAFFNSQERHQISVSMADRLGRR